MVSTIVHSRRKTPVAAEGYFAQWQEVLEACKRCQEDVKGPSREFFQHAQELVQPWVSCDSIKDASHRIRADLLEQCEWIDRRLHGKSDGQRRAHGRWIAILSAALGLSASLLAWSVVPRTTLSRTLEHIRYWCSRTYLAAERAETGEQVAVGVVVMLAIGLWMLYSLRRD